MNRINKPDGPNLKPTSCPYCGEQIDCSSGIGNSKEPRPGDVSICAYCGQPGEFNNQLQIVKLEGTELAKIMADPVVQTSILHIRARKAAADPARQQAYKGQLDGMARDVKEWIINHPDRNPSIQYNFQNEVGDIAALQDAIDHHFISVNADALAMFNGLGWLDDNQSMPTVLMVRVVLEHVFGKEGYFCPGCGATKPESEFPKDVNGATVPGLCVVCESKINQ